MIIQNVLGRRMLSGHALARYSRRQVMVLALAVLLITGLLARAQDDIFNYRFEHYQEDSGRMGVITHSGDFDVTLAPWLAFSGEVVNDAVSGATPNGQPSRYAAPVGSAGYRFWDDSFTTVHMKDNRMAGYGEPTFIFGANRLSIQGSYSGESDYISRGVALNYARDFNQKNTTLNVGWSHDFDTVEQGGSPYGQLFTTSAGQHIDLKKDADDFIVGVNQLLSPKTILTANFEFGYENGYLADPYRGFGFYDNSSLVPERRPGQRTKEVVYVGVTQFVTPLDGSIEGSYRFYSDSYGIIANTASLAWYQKIGKFLVISPSLRYYIQSAADFYHVTLPGYVGNFNYAPGDTLPDGNIQPNIPKYYSADYRLSNMQTITGEIAIRLKVVNHFYVNATYERYVMQGLDGATEAGVYPNANVFSVGGQVTF